MNAQKIIEPKKAKTVINNFHFSRQFTVLMSKIHYPINFISVLSSIDKHQETHRSHSMLKKISWKDIDKRAQLLSLQHITFG